MENANYLNPWPWPTPEPGIYFNMPFADYLNIRCLNAGGIKHLLMSETDFWCRSWMNPLKEDEDTKAREEGRAYHMRILEGKKAFYNAYAPDFEDNPKDETIIRSTDDLKKALKMAKLPVTFATKPAGAARLLAAKPHARILDVMKARHREEYGEKEFLPPKDVRYMELAARMIEFHPELKTYFVGGYPEVTVIWDDPEYRVRFKIRIDYQKIGPPADLKTFANKFQRSIGKAIRKDIDNYAYYIQAFLYLRGINIAKKMVAEGQVFSTWECNQAGDMVGRRSHDINTEWLQLFAKTPAEEFWYIFMQKGIAPVARGAKFSMKDTGFAGVGNEYLLPAVQKFHRAYKLFGEDAWVDISPSEYINYAEMWGF